MNYKKLLYLIVSSTFFIMTACQSILSVQPLSTTDNSPKQQIRQLSTPLPTPDRKEEIISQIKQIASTYNQFIQDEKKTGNFAVTSLGDGTDGFIFTKESEVKVFKEDVLVHQKIEDLNGQYYRIYKEEKGPAPTTTVSSQKDLQVRLSKELNELQIWYSNELMYGAIVKLYSPSDMNYISLLIGESYAIEKEKEENIIALNHILNMPPFDLINLDIKKIQSIEPGEVTYIDNSEVPFYRSDIKLATYETATRSYTLYTNSHEIIEIIPKIIPQTADLTPVASLAVKMLEQKARTLIAIVSPGVNLDILTAVPGSKIGSFFFRWEDRSRAVLDDGTTYPFVQVGLNGNGALLNYYNTLPLAR